MEVERRWKRTFCPLGFQTSGSPVTRLHLPSAPFHFILDPFRSFTTQYLPTHRGLVPVHCPSIHCLCGDPRSIYPSLQVSCTSSGTVWDTFMRFDPFSGSGTFEKEHPSGESIKEARNPIKISPCKLRITR